LSHRRLSILATSFAFLAALLAALGSGAALAAVEIAPHRAIYQMSLKSARNSSKVADVRGRMMFEWADACDGWTIEQRFQLRFLYSEGEDMEMTTNFATWEAKDGLSYRFNVRKTVNGELDEEVKGEAHLNGPGKGGVARYIRPEEQEMTLPAGVLFPTAHTIELIERAKAGEKFLARIVFDGSDAEGSTEISAAVGLPTEAKAEMRNRSPLLKDQGWPVRMAFFPLNSSSAQPEYEMGLLLLKNGVAETMSIDYGDFIVDAVLESVEPLPRSGC